MDLRHLRYFVAVAEELHFGRAARRLHVSQPPLSQQIRDLERELGVTLFDRDRRRVALTDAGSALLGEARATLLQAERAAQAARAAAAGLAGRLRVAFVTSSACSVLPAAIRRLRAEAPGVGVTLHEMTPSRQVEALCRGEADVGLLRPPLQDSSVRLDEILQERLVAALPAGHALTRRAQPSLRDLASEAFVLFPRSHGAGLHDVVLAACRDAGFAPRVEHEPDTMHAVLTTVGAGLGVTVVPESVAGLRGGDVAYRRLRGFRGTIGLSAARPAERDSPLAARFVEACCAVASGRPQATRGSSGTAARTAAHVAR